MRTFLLILALGLNTFTLWAATEQPITIEKPSGGELYQPGATQVILLDPKTKAKQVLIELSRDGGGTFETLGTIDNTVTPRALRQQLS